MQNSELNSTLVKLLALALRLEAEGQYNIAKLARATADSLCRHAAWEHDLRAKKESLATEIERTASSLDNPDVQAALRKGATALAEGRLPLIDETPHPYVCRICGHLALSIIPEICPTCGAWGETFQWFPPVYWLEALDPLEALERLKKTPLEVAVLIEPLSENDMVRQSEDSGWSVRNILSHLRDAQAVISYRLDLFLKEQYPVLEMKAVWTWAKEENEHPPSTREIFEIYQASRREMLDKLEALPLEDWWRKGSHEEFGIVSIKQQVSYFASHELTHMSQLKQAVNQKKT
ncbi:MAG: DinB family protein [Anaerolineales bacterium]|nr:DinB family protein [Anaerolineales bacterium]